MINLNFETVIYISIYFSIGFVLIILLYKDLLYVTHTYIEDNSYIFASYNEKQIKDLINTSIMLCMFIWPFILSSFLIYKIEKLLGITYND